MSAPIPTNEPLELRAGMTWQWRRENLSYYPASSWTLTYWFKQLAAAGAKFSVQATADGDAHAVNVLAATTAGYTADDYSWVAVVTGGASEAYEVDRGTVKLLPKYGTDTALDDRSHARKMLDALEAMAESKASLDQLEYSIGTRQLKRLTPEEVVSWTNYYRSRVFAEDANQRARNGYGAGRILTRL